MSILRALILARNRLLGHYQHMEKIVSRPTNESLGRQVRAKRVPVMMTDDEYDRIAQAAQAAGVGVSTFLRLCAIDASTPST